MGCAPILHYVGEGSTPHVGEGSTPHVGEGSTPHVSEGSNPHVGTCRLSELCHLSQVNWRHGNTDTLD